MLYSNAHLPHLYGKVHLISMSFNWLFLMGFGTCSMPKRGWCQIRGESSLPLLGVYGPLESSTPMKAALWLMSMFGRML